MGPAIGSVIAKPDLTLSVIYANLAIEQGGSGGSVKCAQKTFGELSNIETPGFAEADTYTQLATAAGGTGGSTFCAQKTFSKLV
jgi:hypothetical protein